jgi:hypothetical protein
MTENRRNEPATEPQKEKLRFFGCTWDDGITAGQATDALTECAKLFPDREAAWQMQKTESPKTPETFPVETIEKLDATISAEVTIQVAETVASKPVAATAAFIPPTPEQLDEIRSFGKEPPNGLTFVEAKIWIEQCKILYPAKLQNDSAQGVTIQKVETAVVQPSARHEGFFCEAPVGHAQAPARQIWGKENSLKFISQNRGCILSSHREQCKAVQISRQEKIPRNILPKSKALLPN